LQLWIASVNVRRFKGAVDVVQLGARKGETLLVRLSERRQARNLSLMPCRPKPGGLRDRSIKSAGGMRQPYFVNEFEFPSIAPVNGGRLAVPLTIDRERQCLVEARTVEGAGRMHKVVIDAFHSSRIDMRIANPLQKLFIDPTMKRLHPGNVAQFPSAVIQN